MNELEQCFAKCKRGCTMQYYDCEEENDPVIHGCQDEEWVAQPGLNGLPPLKEGQGVADHAVVRKWRYCEWGMGEISSVHSCFEP